MSHISVSIAIDATPAEVWRIVEPIENHVKWMRDAVAIRFVDEQIRGVGTKFICQTKVGPIKLTDKMEVTQWLPASAMGVKHVGIVTGSGRFTLTPTTNGTATNFTWDEDLHFRWWMGGELGGLVGGKLIMRTIWRRNLRELKKIVENS